MNSFLHLKKKSVFYSNDLSLLIVFYMNQIQMFLWGEFNDFETD